MRENRESWAGWESRQTKGRREGEEASSTGSLGTRESSGNQSLLGVRGIQVSQEGVWSHIPAGPAGLSLWLGAPAGGVASAQTPRRHQSAAAGAFQVAGAL